MSTHSISRRRFLSQIPAWIAAASLWRERRLCAATPQIRVGCQANGFVLKPGDFPALLAALRKMKELGYAGFECNIKFVQDQFGAVADARKQIEDTGVEFISTHNGTALATPEVLPHWVESVAGLGATCMVMSGTGLSRDGHFDPAAVAPKAAGLVALAKTCHEGGLRFAYHNHNPEFANHNAEINALAEATEGTRVEFLMDAGHAHLGGGDPAAFMIQHGRRIFGCHLKTYKGGQAHQVPLGQGDWGFEDLAAAVKATGWTGWLLSEEGGGPTPGDTAALGPDRDYIRNVFGV